MIDELRAALRLQLQQANKILPQEQVEFPQRVSFKQSFSKAPRFPQKKKLDDMLSSMTTMASVECHDSPKYKQSFSQAKRFYKSKADDRLPLNLNYQAVKPKVPTTVIKKNSGSKVGRLVLANEGGETPGPCAYEIDQTDKNKGPTFGLGHRFKAEQPTQQTILFPNYSSVQRKTPGLVIKQSSKANQKQIQLKAAQQSIQKISTILQMTAPADNKHFLTSSPAAKIAQPYIESLLKRSNSREKNAYISHLVSKVSDSRGGFDYDIARPLDGPCPAVIHLDSNKPQNLQQILPGPADYQPDSKPCRFSAPSFTIGQKPKQKHADIDLRDYEPDMRAVWADPKSAVISSISTADNSVVSLEQFLVGPGSYEPNYSQTEANPKSAVIPTLTSKNERTANLGQKRQVNDPLLFPKYTQVQHSQGVPLMKPPSNIKPIHIPDKLLFPEHWQFYDVQPPKETQGGLFAIPKKQFQKAEEIHNLAHEYLKRRYTSAELGQYDPSFKLVEESLGNPITAQQQRFNYFESNQYGNEGDVLILNANPLKDHIQSLDFGKQQGRPEKEFDLERGLDGDRLLLQPKKKQKKIADIKFDKITGRPEAEQNDEFQEQCLLQRPPAKPRGHDFGKGRGRQQKQLDPERAQCLIAIPAKAGTGIKIGRPPLPKKGSKKK